MQNCWIHNKFIYFQIFLCFDRFWLSSRSSQPSVSPDSPKPTPKPVLTTVEYRGSPPNYPLLSFRLRFCAVEYRGSPPNYPFLSFWPGQNAWKCDFPGIPRNPPESPGIPRNPPESPGIIPDPRSKWVKSFNPLKSSNEAMASSVVEQRGKNAMLQQSNANLAASRRQPWKLHLKIKDAWRHIDPSDNRKKLYM